MVKDQISDDDANGKSGMNVVKNFMDSIKCRTRCCRMEKIGDCTIQTTDIETGKPIYLQGEEFKCPKCGREAVRLQTKV